MFYLFIFWFLYIRFNSQINAKMFKCNTRVFFDVESTMPTDSNKNKIVNIDFFHLTKPQYI